MKKSTILPLISLGITVSLALFLFFAGRKGVEPRYAILNSSLLAEAVNEEPKLKILWEEMEVLNVRSVDIAVWNAGAEYLDKRRISQTDPIRIIVPDDIDLLYTKIVRTSRETLLFTLQEKSDSTVHREIEINFNEDEALEKDDGLLIRILYTGPEVDDFKVAGRIKGAKSGFKQVNWTSITAKDLPGYVPYAILVP